MIGVSTFLTVENHSEKNTDTFKYALKLHNSMRKTKRFLQRGLINHATNQKFPAELPHSSITAVNFCS